MTILLATNNKHKVVEMRAILQGLQDSVEIITLADRNDVALDVEETGQTLEENAYLKARAFFDATGIACVADDTGLEIDYLDGAPGVRTARFAGEQASYNDNVRLVLERLTAVEMKNRGAQFRTVICYIDEQRTLFAEGSCHGTIAMEASGDAGFGYDPIFIPEGSELTFAQMDARVKNSISHRGRALQAFSVTMQAYYHSESSKDSHPQNNPDSRALHSVEVGGKDESPSEHSTSFELQHFLCLAASAAAVNNQKVVQQCTEAFIKHGSDFHLLYEALLQTYLFAGFPAALEGLRSFASCLRAHDCTWLVDEDENYDVQSFHRRGIDTCRLIYTGVYTNMREHLSLLSPHLDEWMIVEGYGKVLSRPQLSLARRELINVAILATCSWERQLYSHLRGALNVGVSLHDCEMALNCSLLLKGEEVFLEAKEVLARVQNGRDTRA